MGVAGAGKTTVGRALAAELGWGFVDADDLHTPASRDAMRRGIPLADAQRGPWLEAVRAEIARRLDAGSSVVVACSALRAAYRVIIGEDDPRVRFVHLAVPPEEIG